MNNDMNSVNNNVETLNTNVENLNSNMNTVSPVTNYPETPVNNYPENNKKKSGKGKGIIIVLLLLIILGLVGYILYDKGIILNDKKEVKEEKTAKKETTKNESLEFTSTVKDKVNKFIKAASVYKEDGYAPFTHFNKGTTSISDEMKYKMVYYTLEAEDKIVKKESVSSEELKGIEGVTPDAQDNIFIIKIADFDNVYKELFDETADYEIKDIESAGCPAPMAINKSAGNIYLFDRCGGTSMIIYDTDIISYDSDENYYYVYQKVKSSTPDSSEEYELVWKFDEDLKFVSTERKDK